MTIQRMTSAAETYFDKSGNKLDLSKLADGEHPAFIANLYSDAGRGYWLSFNCGHVVTEGGRKECIRVLMTDGLITPTVTHKVARRSKKEESISLQKANEWLEAFFADQDRVNQAWRKIHA